MLAGNAVAHLVINRGAHALRKAHKPQGSRGCPMSDSIIINNSIDLLRGHASLNILSYLIQNTRINLAGFANASDLLRSFNHAAVRHLLALGTQQFNFRINHLVTVAISLTTATPAQIIFFFHVILLKLKKLK